MKCVIPFGLGIITGWYLFLPLIWTVIGVLIAIAASSFLLLKHAESPLLPVSLFILLFLFGIVKITWDGKYVFREDIENFISSERTVSVRGIVTDEPRSTSYTVKLVLAADSLKISTQWAAVRGGIVVSAKRAAFDTTLCPMLTYGTRVEVAGQLVAFSPPRNPGEFDFKSYLSLNDIFAKFMLDSIVIESRETHGFLAALVYPLRRSVSQRIEILIGGDEGNFLKGLIVGERTDIDASVKSAFINAGVMHILAVSGLHVVIVLLMLTVLFKALRIPERIRILLSCAFLVYYNFLTGGAASVARSVIMAMIVLAGGLFERKQNMYNTLAASALILLFWDARQLFQAGFQLSYGAVFSLVYCYPKINAATELLPWGLGKTKTVSLIVEVMGVSVAATIGTLPFTASYFGKISIIGILANIVLVPLSNAVLALGMLTVLVSYLSWWIATVYAATTHLVTAIFLWGVKFFGTMRYASVGADFTIFTSIGFYLIAGGLLHLYDLSHRKRAVIVFLAGCDLLLLTNIVHAGDPYRLRVTFLDVGQGDCEVVEFPDGMTMVVDAGQRMEGYDLGARVVIPYLKWRGIRTVDAVVVTHPHSDHLGGIPALLRGLSVRDVIDAGSTAKSYLCQEFGHILDSLGVRVDTVRAGCRLRTHPMSRSYVLHPSGEFLPSLAHPARNLNNESVVLKIVFGATTLLLEGDAEREAEARMVRLYDRFLGADLLKVGHHGSPTSSSIPMIERVKPQTAVISVGARNKFGHPSPRTLALLNRMHCRYFRTDQEGAVMYESDGRSWHRIDWRKP